MEGMYAIGPFVQTLRGVFYVDMSKQVEVTSCTSTSSLSVKFNKCCHAKKEARISNGAMLDVCEHVHIDGQLRVGSTNSQSLGLLLLFEHTSDWEGPALNTPVIRRE